MTRSDGQFDWGGLTTKPNRGQPKGSSVRTEISRRGQGQKLPSTGHSVSAWTAKAGPQDPYTHSIIEEFVWGDRKVTTGITGLWWPSVLSDATS